ncbi:uncharacterized protein CMU_014000 [Cryptosporidium muris RN66]|uniref:Man1/Src1-like C-terminal domain-containing protein n=1 Tax=Cryptosporidium muris (strain RN66) TaxID=441375 RepID=B6AEV8_CRYMR|nr:uncharacterized protein CMU_014000 [Cryptosporidium muris RN66]EEA06725.1 hypothetical protein, conserved [Cryptosporidium muris RN66]|eukprot:XP_002141074.1 hypothetical protein [Cryptosporidium muris RN66]
MPPKQRKSIAAINSSGNTDSPWKLLTRMELFHVIDENNIPITSDKLLKADLINLIELHLNDSDCRKWLEYYEKPLPYPEFGKNNTNYNIGNTTNKKKGRYSVPAYLAVAELNTERLESDINFQENTMDSTQREMQNINVMETSSFSEELDSNTYLKTKISSPILINRRKRDSISHKVDSNDNINTTKVVAQDHNMETNKSSFYLPSFKALFSLLYIFPSLKKIIILSSITLLFSIGIILYNKYSIFILEPKFCDSDLKSKDLKSSSCKICPVNGHCKYGILNCNFQYKKALRYIHGKWTVLCIYDDEAHDLAEEMLLYITSRLRKLKGYNLCYIRDNNNLSKLSEHEINEMIKLSFNYYNEVIILNAISIMWNSIKNSNVLKKYRLTISTNKLENNQINRRNIDDIDNVSKPLLKFDNTDIIVSNYSTISSNKTNYENTIYIEAIDSQIPLLCQIKLYLKKWAAIYLGILLITWLLYYWDYKRKREKLIINKIRDIIYRENRKDITTGLFIGPDTLAIARLLRTELPQYRNYLTDNQVNKICRYVEVLDPNIQKTQLSDNNLPYYWVAKDTIAADSLHNSQISIKNNKRGFLRLFFLLSP